MKVHITAEAEADLETIGDYIARDNPARTVSFVRELYQVCRDIADQPQTWPLVRRDDHGQRFVHLGGQFDLARVSKNWPASVSSPARACVSPLRIPATVSA